MCAYIVHYPYVCLYCPLSLCVLILSSILMCTHIVHYPYVCLYCPVSLCVLILSTILMCAHIVQYPYVYSYCPLSLCVLILSSILMCTHIVHYPYVCLYCPVSLCVLILSTILMYVCSYCPLSSCVLRVSSILRAQVGQFVLFPTGVMVAVYNSYETSAARWTYSSPFTALPCFSGDRHRWKRKKKKKREKNADTCFSLSFAVMDEQCWVFFKKEGKKLYKKQEKSAVQRELTDKLRTPVLTFRYAIILMPSQP